MSENNLKSLQIALKMRNCLSPLNQYFLYLNQVFANARLRKRNNFQQRYCVINSIKHVVQQKLQKLGIWV